jgi:hypothetical protein
MSWTILGFGKHKSKTLPQVLFINSCFGFTSVEEHVEFASFLPYAT